MKKIFSATVLLALSSLLSKFLGIIRNNRFAAIFGAGVFSDAYYAAFQIPDLIYNLVIYGAVSAAFVPIFSRYLAKKDLEKAWGFTNNILNIFLFFIVLVSVLLFIIAPFLIPLLYPGFDVMTVSLAVSLTRIMLLSPIFLGVSAILGSIQNAFHTFWAYSMAPLLYNLSIVLSIVFLAPYFGITGVAYGVVFGAFLHMLVQVPVVFKRGFSYRFFFNAKDKDVKQTLILAAPRVFGLAAYNISLLVEATIASTVLSGGLTLIRYAQDIQFFPVSLIGFSVAVAHFGVISKIIAEKKHKVLATIISRNIHTILFLIIPASVGLFVLRVEIITLLLGYGEFTQQDILDTANLVAVFSSSLFAISLVPFLTRVFYAFHDTCTPVFISLFTLIFHIGGSFILSKFYGIPGIAISSVVAVSIQFFLLFYFLNKRLSKESITLPFAFPRVFWMIFSALAMGVIIEYSKIFLPFSLLWQILLLAAGGFVLYVGFTYFLLENSYLRQKVLSSRK